MARQHDPKSAVDPALGRKMTVPTKNLRKDVFRSNAQTVQKLFPKA